MSEADNNPFKIGTSGEVESEPPTLEQRLEFKEHLLEEAAKLLTRTQDELTALRNHVVSQEAELRELREELSKAE